MPKRIHRRRDVDPSEGGRKYGDAAFADPTNKKYPIDTPGRIKAARAAKYTAAERRTIQAQIRNAATAR